MEDQFEPSFVLFFYNDNSSGMHIKEKSTINWYRGFYTEDKKGLIQDIRKFIRIQNNSLSIYNFTGLIDKTVFYVICK